MNLKKCSKPKNACQQDNKGLAKCSAPGKTIYQSPLMLTELFQGNLINVS